MKCVRCGAVCTENNSCPVCNADISRMKKDTSYLLQQLSLSRPFRALSVSAGYCITASIIGVIFGLFSGMVSIPISLILTAVGITVFAKTSQSLNVSPVSTAPINLFNVSVILEAVTYAIYDAVCIAICIGGRSTMEFLFNSLKEASGTDIVSDFLTLASEQGIPVTEELLYLSVYAVGLVGMFVCTAAVIANFLELFFLSSLKSSIKTNEVNFKFLGVFNGVMLFKGIFGLFMLLFSAGISSMITFAASAFLYFNAFKCGKSLKNVFN